ncbi:MAG: hypothetical protein N2249_03610 [Melioribacter sp.]|nr:hypothetical protein [Melioribacter sp.]
MKRVSKIVVALFFLFAPLISLTIILQCGNTQEKKSQISNGNNNKKKREIIAQNIKEYNKAKELKVKLRKRFAGFYGKDGSYPEKLVLVEELFFDQNGNRKKLIRYKSTGEIDFSYEFKYDKNNNLIATETYDGFGNLKGKSESQYDKNNNEILRTVLDNSSAGELKTEFFYDSAKRLIKTINYSKKGEIASTQQLEYDGELVIKSIIKDSNGKKISETKYEYDNDGYLIKETLASIQGDNEINYKYDPNGNLIEVKNKQTRREYKYDSKGNIIEDKLFLSDGTRQFRVTFSYYENGLQKEEIRYTNDDKPAFLAKYEYEFY